jgi:capsular exopolysaccharide synthesis family protein
MVQVKKHPGLSSYLIEKANLEDIIIPTKIPGFDVIHSGQIPPNPIELVHSPRTEELIVELKRRYDYVILDTPPYGLLSDPFVLMKYSDLNLYVTRAGYTKKSEFIKNIEDIESKKIDHLYVVVNDDKEERKAYGKYKYYTKEPVKKGLLKKKT